MSLCLDPHAQATTMVRRWGTVEAALNSAALCQGYHVKGSPAHWFWGRVIRSLKQSRRSTKRRAA